MRCKPPGGAGGTPPGAGIGAVGAGFPALQLYFRLIFNKLDLLRPQVVQQI